MISLAFFIVLSAIGYIVAQIVHLHKEKVSTRVHEEYVRKKEIEYCVGINDEWKARYYFIFSSFKCDTLKMYHRPIFNIFVFLLVTSGVLVPKENGLRSNVIFVLFGVLLVCYCTTRPYRCMSTNILGMLLSLIMVINSVIMMLKENGFRTAVIIDSYLWILLTVVNLFLWFFVAVFIAMLVVTKRKWVSSDGLIY